MVTRIIQPPVQLGSNEFEVFIQDKLFIVETQSGKDKMFFKISSPTKEPTFIIADLLSNVMYDKNLILGLLNSSETTTTVSQYGGIKLMPRPVHKIKRITAKTPVDSDSGSDIDRDSDRGGEKDIFYDSFESNTSFKQFPLVKMKQSKKIPGSKISYIALCILASFGVLVGIQQPLLANLALQVKNLAQEKFFEKVFKINSTLIVPKVINPDLTYTIEDLKNILSMEWMNGTKPILESDFPDPDNTQQSQIVIPTLNVTDPTLQKWTNTTSVLNNIWTKETLLGVPSSLPSNLAKIFETYGDKKKN